jgi:hypothetical protein
MFLDVLSGCTVGRFNITTVEAKVQSVFNYVDIVDSILDPGTIIAARIRLSKFFYNSIIEVELKIPGLEQSACIWKLLESYKLVFETAKDDILAADKFGWNSPKVSRQKIEYIITCVMIVHGFFGAYYHPSIFRAEVDRDNKNRDQTKVSMTVSQADEIITFFFYKIKEIPGKGKEIQRDTLISFAWVGDLRGQNFYSSSKALQKEAMGKHRHTKTTP